MFWDSVLFILYKSLITYLIVTAVSIILYDTTQLFFYFFASVMCEYCSLFAAFSNCRVLFCMSLLPQNHERCPVSPDLLGYKHVVSIWMLAYLQAAQLSLDTCLVPDLIRLWCLLIWWLWCSTSWGFFGHLTLFGYKAEGRRPWTLLCKTEFCSTDLNSQNSGRQWDFPVSTVRRICPHWSELLLTVPMPSCCSGVTRQFPPTTCTNTWGWRSGVSCFLIWF